MSLAPVVSPYLPINGLTGLGLNGGFLYIGLDGQDPEPYPQNCYWDSAGLVLAAQPIDILGGYPMYLGSPARLYTASTYSIRVRDRSGVQVFYEAHAVPAPTVTAGVFLTYAAAVAAFIPGAVQATGLNIAGYYAPNDGGGANYIYAPVQAAGAGKFQSADGAWWQLVADTLLPEMFGAVGDGAADDTAALNRFFAYLSGRAGLMVGVYKVTTELLVTLSNCRLYGTPGHTKITGSFGYAVVRLGAQASVIFDGIKFETTYVNAVEDTGKSVVYSLQNNLFDTRFVNCTFTAPSANTGGLTVYARINAGDTSATMDGLWIEDCDFTDIGRIGCTLMNRSTTADQMTAARRVYFNRNKGKNLGLSGSFGFLLSLDGFGSEYTVHDNYVFNALGIGIENTCWSYGSFRGNRFDGFSRAYAPMSFSNNGQTFHGGAQGYMLELYIADNKTVSPANSRSNFIGVKDSYFAGNVFRAAGDFAFHERDATGNRHFGDHYISNTLYAALIGLDAAVTTGNHWDDCLFDLSGAAAGTGALTFDGSGTSRNVVTGKILKGTTGFAVLQQNSAADNFVPTYTIAGLISQTSYQRVDLADADYVATAEVALVGYDVVRFNGAWTGGHSITLPISRFAKPIRVFNTTGQTITFAVPGGAGGDTLANLAVANIAYDLNANYVRVV